MPKIFIITGQTATGKTKLALKYVKKYRGELINCDSRQIYKHLDIITGKDLTHKHWLYDMVDPEEHFSSYDFKRLAMPLIRDILKKGKTPIIVGGTYFYLFHLLYEVETEEIPANWRLRKKLEKNSVVELQNIYKTISLQSFNRLNASEKNNPQRLIRKIEIAMYYQSQPELVSGSEIRFRNKFGMTLNRKLNFPNLEIGLIGLKFKEKDDLRKAIEKRVEERLQLGAIDEVKKLLKMGYKETSPGLKTIGYQQLILHLKGAIDLDTAIHKWINKEVQYAKRQYTFMKKDKNINWHEIE